MKKEITRDRRIKKPVIWLILCGVPAAILIAVLLLLPFGEDEWDRPQPPVQPLIDTSGFVDVNTKNNLDLVNWAKIAYDNQWGYVYGTWGNKLTQTLLDNKSSQYPEYVREKYQFIEQNYMGRRVTDCVGLIKGYCWYSQTDGFVYGSNDMPDIGANRMIENADKKGTIDTIPEIPGLAVWKKGHIGVYIGDGWVIEAMGTLDGVKKTRLVDRTWTHWCQIPYIEYLDNK